MQLSGSERLSEEQRAPLQKHFRNCKRRLSLPVQAYQLSESLRSHPTVTPADPGEKGVCPSRVSFNDPRWPSPSGAARPPGVPRESREEVNRETNAGAPSPTLRRLMPTSAGSRVAMAWRRRPALRTDKCPRVFAFQYLTFSCPPSPCPPL